jgi:hypothetical protein
MRHALLALALLSGCAQVGRYGAQDAATAAGIAAAVGDTAVRPYLACFLRSGGGQILRPSSASKSARC